MANKGLQFEHPMYAAASKIVNKSKQNQKDYYDAASRHTSIKSVKDKAEEIIEKMAPELRDLGRLIISRLQVSGGKNKGMILCLVMENHVEVLFEMGKGISVIKC